MNKVQKYIREETLAMYSDPENMFDKNISLDISKDDLYNIILEDKDFLKYFVECVESDMKIIKDIGEPELYRIMSDAIKTIKVNINKLRKVCY